MNAIGDFFGTILLVVTGFVSIVFALVIAGLLFLGGC